MVKSYRKGKLDVYYHGRIFPLFVYSSYAFTAWEKGVGSAESVD